MREIKFRAWDLIEKKMLGWGEIFHLPSWEVFPGTPEQRAFEIMQYTGLKDKNGKEIYEGDIVRIFNDELDETDSWVDEVSYHMCAFFSGDEDLLCNVNFRAEVIGNIYENPELLGDSN